jgi:hypothetical protein
MAERLTEKQNDALNELVEELWEIAELAIAARHTRPTQTIFPDEGASYSAPLNQDLLLAVARRIASRMKPLAEKLAECKAALGSLAEISQEKKPEG